jgi:hypothetical protein
MSALCQRQTFGRDAIRSPGRRHPSPLTKGVSALPLRVNGLDARIPIAVIFVTAVSAAFQVARVDAS